MVFMRSMNCGTYLLLYVPMPTFIFSNHQCSDDLIKFLRPFAQEGKVVNESDVTSFFATLTEAAKSGRR